MKQIEITELTNAAMLYRFLSHRLLHEPTAVELREFVVGETCKSLIDMDCDLLDGITTYTPEDQSEMLAVDYCKLFIGPGTHLSPHESVVLGEGQLMGECAKTVMDIYSEAGFVLDPSERSMQDHIGVELAFVATLLENEAECLKREDEFGAEKFREIRINFLTNHVAKVLPVLTDYVLEHAVYPFYKNLLRFTRDWIEVDKEVEI
jgi:putative dimethyl sulfoxide reductase chaperone